MKPGLRGIAEINIMQVQRNPLGEFFRHFHQNLSDTRGFYDVCVLNEPAALDKPRHVGYAQPVCWKFMHISRPPTSGRICLHVFAGVCSAEKHYVCGCMQYVSEFGWQSSYQSLYQAGLSRWCSCHCGGVCGSCCPQRRLWQWTGPGAHHQHSSSPTSWPLAGRIGQSQPLCSGAYNSEVGIAGKKLAGTQHSTQCVFAFNIHERLSYRRKMTFTS